MVDSRRCKHSAEMRHLLAAAPGILTGYLPLFKLSKSGCFPNTIRTEVQTSTEIKFLTSSQQCFCQGRSWMYPWSLKIPLSRSPGSVAQPVGGTSSAPLGGVACPHQAQNDYWKMNL